MHFRTEWEAPGHLDYLHFQTKWEWGEKQVRVNVVNVDLGNYRFWSCSSITRASILGSEPLSCALVFDFGVTASVQGVAKENTHCLYIKALLYYIDNITGQMPPSSRQSFVPFSAFRSSTGITVPAGQSLDQ